jgi:hypothetical protein
MVAFAFAFTFTFAAGSLRGQSDAPASPPSPESAASAADPEAGAITKTALDYIEGWYEGDGARMERAVHPDLAKRIVNTDPASGRSSLGHQSAMTLVQAARAGWGKRTPPDKRQKDVTILDRFGNAAVVKIVATDWIDYLQEAKFNGEWKIVNVLWERKAPASAPAVAK